MSQKAGRPLRFQDAEQLADAIIARVGKKIVLALPLGLGKANHIANALFARAMADPTIHLNIFTALTLEPPRLRQDLEKRFLGPISERLFGGYPELAYAVALKKNRVPNNIEINEFFFEAGQWLGNPKAQQHYISANYTHALRYVLERGVNVVAQLVAKQDGDTRYSLSCNPDLTLDLLEKRKAGAANFLFAGQINSELPFMPGESDIAADEFDFMLDGPGTDFSLFAPPREPIDLTDYACGLHAASTVCDGGTLQLGIGSLGDAVAQALRLRHQKNADFGKLLAALGAGPTGPAMGGTEPFATGLYGCSELFVESLLDLFQAGILKREVDGAVLHAGFFVGSKWFYRTLREMPKSDLKKLQMTRIGFVNELYGDEMNKRRARVKARFLNNAMMATLLGDVNSDALENGQVVSGVGGQYNFVAQSFALDDARSVLMLRSARQKRNQSSSNIRWSYGHITIPRHLRDVVITEYGVADLRGKPDRDVIAAMLAISDTRYQPELLRTAKDAGKIEKEYEIPASARENTPERIARALQPFQEQGLLPLFPFGTDFTDTEQKLVPALQALSAASPLQIAQYALRGWRQPSASTQDCLMRMGLASPASLKDRFYRALLTGALS